MRPDGSGIFPAACPIPPQQTLRYIHCNVEQKHAEAHLESINLGIDHYGTPLLLHTEMGSESDRYQIYPSITYSTRRRAMTDHILNYCGLLRSSRPEKITNLLPQHEQDRLVQTRSSDTDTEESCSGSKIPRHAMRLGASSHEPFLPLPTLYDVCSHMCSCWRWLRQA